MSQTNFIAALPKFGEALNGSIAYLRTMADAFNVIGNRHAGGELNGIANEILDAFDVLMKAANADLNHDVKEAQHWTGNTLAAMVAAASRPGGVLAETKG